MGDIIAGIATWLRRKTLYRIQLAALSATLAAFGFAGGCWAQSPQQMQFRALPPLQPAEVFGNAWTIYADGNIDADAGPRLEQLIRDNGIPPKSLLYLNSPGGNLMGGITLGRVMRNALMLASVGRETADRLKPQAGECLGACALAFLGGDFRYMVDGSVYGVHRFKAANADGQSADTAQVVSAEVVQYIRDMDVDPALFTEMSKAGSGEINRLSTADLKRLNVVNDGVKPTTWTVESIDQGIYLKGQRETIFGIGKFMFLCAGDDQLGLYVIFDPQGREQETLAMKAVSLMIDGRKFPIVDRQVEAPHLVDGMINAVYVLDDTLLRSIQHAKTVGFQMQNSYDAGVFMGFDGMDFTEGAKKLPGFRKMCPK
jgi:hypothetical protein